MAYSCTKYCLHRKAGRPAAIKFLRKRCKNYSVFKNIWKIVQPSPLKCLSDYTCRPYCLHTYTLKTFFILELGQSLNYGCKSVFLWRQEADKAGGLPMLEILLAYQGKVLAGWQNNNCHYWRHFHHTLQMISCRKQWRRLWCRGACKLGLGWKGHNATTNVKKFSPICVERVQFLWTSFRQVQIVQAPQLHIITWFLPKLGKTLEKS